MNVFDSIISNIGLKHDIKFKLNSNVEELQELNQNVNLFLDNNNQTKKKDINQYYSQNQEAIELPSYDSICSQTI